MIFWRRPGRRCLRATLPFIAMSARRIRRREWLFYVKAGCSRADRLAPFLLHLFPAEVSHLPRERWQYGFDNLDFAFVGYRWPSPGAVRGRPATARLSHRYHPHRPACAGRQPVVGKEN